MLSKEWQIDFGCWILDVKLEKNLFFSLHVWAGLFRWLEPGATNANVMGMGSSHILATYD